MQKAVHITCGVSGGKYHGTVITYPVGGLRSQSLITVSQQTRNPCIKQHLSAAALYGLPHCLNYCRQAV